MTRTLQPELLDSLPAADLEAIRSRADLRRVNVWMRHRQILTRALHQANLTKPKHLVELGAGDGTLALALARELSPHWPEVELTLVDQQLLVTADTLEKFRNLTWQPRVLQADVFAWLAAATEHANTRRSDIIFTNLFLHHFDEARLRRLLRDAAACCSTFIALEPRRHFTARLSCELLWLIGCNRVTRHDARASVRAGFHGSELSQFWPDPNAWKLREQSVGLFSHLFLATRTAP